MSTVLNTLVVLGGWLGAAEILLAYILVSRRRVHGDSLSYQALNISGSFLVMVNCLSTGAWSSVFINLFYLVVGLTVVMTARSTDMQHHLRRTTRLPGLHPRPRPGHPMDHRTETEGIFPAQDRPQDTHLEALPSQAPAEETTPRAASTLRAASSPARTPWP